MEYRREKDSLGVVKVPKNVYWGAQTGRSLHYFSIGIEKMPNEIIQAFAYLKKSTTIINQQQGLLTQEKADAIIQATDEILNNQLKDNFPLSVWQTGSGTQTNMNINEVLANRATEILNSDIKVSPHDDVNRSQSSNDTFPTALHIAITLAIKTTLLPAIKEFEDTLENKTQEFDSIIKIGRTHLQDAVPLTLGQEFSGYKEMIHKNYTMIESILPYVKELAIGGTAVGTGLNAHKDFGEKVTKEISKLTHEEFISAPNKFHALTSHDTLVSAHGILKALASDLMKIANDIRWLSSGPRCGLGELQIQANEPGSSIMPGKVNPTQSEAITMVVAQIMGNDTTIGFAASQGNFELNVFQPVIGYNFLQSIQLLSDAINSFNKNCIVGIIPNKDKINEYLENSLMLATALNPHIGYSNTAKIVQEAFKNNLSLKEATLKLKLLSEEEFDKYVDPQKMV